MIHESQIELTQKFNLWEPIPFKGNIHILNGFPFASENFNEEEGMPLIRIRNLISSKIETLYKGNYDLNFVIKKGDILIGMDGDFHIVKWMNSDAILNQRIMKIYSDEKSKLDLDFIYYRLQSFLSDLHSKTTATTVKHLSSKSLMNAEFLAPPLKEQQKIASILSTVDEKIEVIEEQIKETETLKKGLMQQLLTKGIGHTKFKDSPLGEIPENWEFCRLGQLVEKVGSGITPKGGNESYLQEGILFIRSQNVLRGKLKLSEVAYISKEQHDIMKGSKIRCGDVLLNITGASIGRAAVVPEIIVEGNVNQHVCIIRTLESLNNDFLCHYLNSSHGQNQIVKFQAGGNREGLNFQQIRSFDIPFPTQSEQTRISIIINTVIEKLESLQSRKENFQELKKGLMQQLLTGKMRIKI